jgi:hypothetical protein
MLTGRNIVVDGGVTAVWESAYIRDRGGLPAASQTWRNPHGDARFSVTAPTPNGARLTPEQYTVMRKRHRAQ